MIIIKSNHKKSVYWRYKITKKGSKLRYQHKCFKADSIYFHLLVYWVLLIIKLKSKVQASALDYVFPLSQQEQEQDQPRQNLARESILEVLNLT